MAKFTEVILSPDDPIFHGGAQVFKPIPRPATKTCKQFTHNFIVLGSPLDTCCLTSLDDDRGMPPEWVKPVCLDELPVIEVDRIPAEPLEREGKVKAVFIELWTIASDGTQDELYCKHDWSRLDESIFCPFQQRSIEDREDIVRIIRRQWALAREFPRYDESRWRDLLRLIEQG